MMADQPSRSTRRASSRRAGARGRAALVVAVVVIVIASVAVIVRNRDVAVADPALRISPSVSPTASTVVAEVGGGFTAGERVELYLDSTDVADVTAPSDGVAKTGIGIPTRAAPGIHWITAVGSTSHHVVRANVLVRTNWTQSGFDATHDGFNIWEQAINGLSVYRLRDGWSARLGSGTTGPVAVTAGVAYAVSNGGTLSAFPADGCGTATCAPTWTAHPGGTLFGPSVASGAAFVTSGDGKLLAYDAAGCGAKTCDPSWTAGAGSGVAAPPAVSGAVVYTGSTDGTVSAFKSGGCGGSTCSPAWSASVGSPVTGAPTLGWVASLSKTVLYVGTQDGHVVALDVANGSRLWSVSVGGPVSGSIAFANEILKFTMVLYVTTTDGSLSSLNGANGKLRWGDRPTPGRALSPPTVVTSRVFVGSSDGQLFAYQAEGCEKGERTCSPLWSGGAAGDAGIVAQPSSGGGVVYVTRQNGTLDVFDVPGCKQPACPTPLWSSGSRARATGSATVVNGRLFVGTDEGSVRTYDVPGEKPPPAMPAVSELHPWKWPFRHVVIVSEENHSFDNELGYLCWHWSHPSAPAPEAVQKRPGMGMTCDGAVTGKAMGYGTLPLRKSPDIVPMVEHTHKAHELGIHGGKMDGFDRISGCTLSWNFGCYTQYYPSQVPNFTRLGANFVISDRTFENDATATWGNRIDLIAAKLGGFVGDIPQQEPGGPRGPGWGCDSMKVTTFHYHGRLDIVPSCFPRTNGTGPFRPSPVPYEPTILDSYDRAGLSWRIYEAEQLWSNGNVWSMCPTFSECMYGPQAGNMRPAKRLIHDAKAGTLPSVAYALPFPGAGSHHGTSEHNGTSMAKGDNQVGRDLEALMHGPEWKSTVVFITYDECGCFYDHVTPPPGLGIRIPMLIVSPYTKRGFTDHHTASISSVLAFIEHLYGIKPLTNRDRNAYDFVDSFNFGQPNYQTVAMTEQQIPHWEAVWLRKHPVKGIDWT